MFRALNEKKNDEDCTQDGSFKKPTKEAQEEEAMEIYNQAMVRFAQSKYEEAAQLFQDVLLGPYLNEVNSSPKQIQFRLGCYKNLSKIYSSMKDPDYEASKSILLQAIKAEPNNTNLWYQLGQIGMKMIDFNLAFDGFSEALRCAPGHWSCIEKLIDISYITDDYISCLHYCAMGIEKDNAFLRGHVFRDIIFDDQPFYKDMVKMKIENPEQLTRKFDGDYNIEELKAKYLIDINELKTKEKKIILDLKNNEKEERSKAFVNPCTLKTNSLSALIQTLLLINEAVQELGTFLRPVILENEIDQDENENGIKKGFSSTSCNVDLNESKSQNSPTSNDGKQQKESEAERVQNGVVNNDDYNQEEKPNDDDVQNENETTPGKKKSKRDVRWWQIEGKRRSQRVKGIVAPLCNNFNSVKRKEEEEVFSDALKSIIHSSFNYDESLEKDENNTEPLESNKVGEGDNYFGSLNEEMDVKNFIKENNNDNIVNIINNFLTFLCNDKSELVWPDELANGFIHLYQVYRSHTMVPDLSFDKDLPSFTLDTRITLTFLEMVVDNLCPVKNSLTELQANTLCHLNEIIQENQDNVEYQNLFIRLYWVQSNLLLKLEQNGKKNGKTSNHQQVHDYLQASLEKFKKFGLNCIKISTKKDNIISLAELVKKISCVEKFRNIDQVHELYNNKKFVELIEILNYSQTNIHEVKNDELIHQFYLADAYFQVEKYHEAINQCVKILKFPLSNYQIITKCLIIIDSVLQIYIENITFQDHKKITNQVVQMLIAYASKAVVARSPLYTLPWCILHRILSYYERMEPSIYLTEDTPNSIKLLQFAHECLSKNSKCLVDDGKLLRYTIEKINSCSEDYFEFEDTRHCIEQAIFCLYNHPHKKPRYLNEHNTSGLSCSLVWENCKDVYLYYKPEKLPEFDSFTNESINNDVATLYQRILSLMPEIYKPTEEEITNVLKFLDGKGDNINEHRREGSTTFPQDFNDIYFLIGDYYLKAKEWKKAVEYSVSDLTFNPYRFDSLIIVAMAKGAVLSEQFYSCNEYTPEDVIATSNQIAKCYEKSLMLDPRNSKIQLEFGSFIYGVHSFCSRLTKQSSDEMNIDKFNLIDLKKYEYLKKAAECFEHFHRSTNEINIGEDDDVHEEIWFHHYMLGKIQEKLNESDPAKYLSQYELAGRLLHQLDKNNKSCPKKINYYNPPELAIETLEIYYRLHASILVYIEKHDYCEEKEKVLAEFIERASQTPFALGRSTDCDSKRSKKEDNRLIIKELLECIIDRVVRVVDVENCSEYSFMENQNSIIDSQSKLSHSQLSTNSNIEKHDSIVQMTKPVKTFEEGKFYQDFKDVKFGRLVAKCLEAFELCISRFPQHHKSYYRIALTYSNMLKNYSMSRVYYFGRFQDPCNQDRKINGLFCDRKQNNIFNNVRRNPIEDIDRLGSFSYHMAKAIHHAIDILHHLKDHHLLNEIGVLLSKQPELDKKYMYTNEREQLRDLAFSFSQSIKKSLPTPTFISNNNGNYYSNISQEKSSANAYLKNINQNAICNGQAEENQFGYQQKQRQNINNLQTNVTGSSYNNPIPNSNISTKINSTQISTDGLWMSNNSATMTSRNNINSLNTRKEIPAKKTSLSLNKNNHTNPVSSSVSNSSIQKNKEVVVADSRNKINIQNKVPSSKTSISNNSNNKFIHATKNQTSTTTDTTTTTSAASYQQQQPITHRYINNTSPYQVQTKYLTNPSYVFQHDNNDQSQSMAGSLNSFMNNPNPPHAHRSNPSYFSSKSPPRTQNNDFSSEKNNPEIIDLTCKTPPKLLPFRFDTSEEDPLKIDSPSPPKEDPLKIDTPPKDKDRVRIDKLVMVKRPPILDPRILELQERKKADEEERKKEWKSLNDANLKSLKKPNPNPLPNLVAIPGAANSSLLSRNKNESQMKKSTGNLNKINVEERVSLKRPMQLSEESYNSLPPKKKHLKLSKNLASNSSNSTINSSKSHQSISSSSSSVSQRSGFIFQDPSDGKIVIKPQIIIID